MSDDDTVADGERIAKALARAGVGSRREVEAMIAAGRIAIDGAVLTTPAHKVATLAGVSVDGKPVTIAQATRVWRYHKPRGLLCTSRDPQGRATIFEHLPPHLPRLLSVGRLDINTEGLLLLTNDGALARWLELPSTGWRRHYRVRAHGELNEKRLAALGEGATIDGIHYAPATIEIERSGPSNHWLTVAISEGKNREVRKLIEAAGLTVNRLIRTQYGPFSLGSLKPGEVTSVPVARMERLLDGYFKRADSKAGLVAPRGDRSKWAKAKPRPAGKPGAKAGGKAGGKHAAPRRPRRATLSLKK